VVENKKQVSVLWWTQGGAEKVYLWLLLLQVDGARRTIYEQRRKQPQAMNDAMAREGAMVLHEMLSRPESVSLAERVQCVLLRDRLLHGLSYEALFNDPGMARRLATALAQCADATYEDAEVRRDSMRLELSECVPDYVPRMRSYPME
jgi:hypothetical protein